MAAAGVGAQQRLQRDPHIRWDRFTLPAFDAHVYVAMAESPSFFTVAPWGYRVLTPALVHALPVPNVVRGFRVLTAAALALAAVALFGFLRALGHGEAASLLGTAAFCALPPVAQCIRYPFLSEPLSVLLETLFLLALASGAGLGVLALVATLAALSKDLLLVLLPLVVLARARREGWPRALGSGAAVAALPLLTTLLLRRVWPDPAAAAGGLPSLVVLGSALGRIAAAWPQYWTALLLGGLLPLALAGAFRGRAREYVRAYGPLALVTTLLPLAAAVYAGGSEPVPFFAADVPRLLLYAAPLLLPLALALLPGPALGASEAAGRPALSRAAAVAAVLVALAPLVLLDRYRRADLSGPRDGPLVLSLSRETLRTAARLAEGGAVSFGDARHYTWGESDPGALAHMRWFLRDGWGPRAHYDEGPMVTREPSASVLVPSFGSPLSVTLDLSASTPTAVRVGLNGTTLATTEAGPVARSFTVTGSAPLLFRGDNVLRLDGAPGVRLHALTLAPAAPTR